MLKRIALCLLVSGVVSCQAPPCDHDLQEGEVYKAVVLAPYSESGPYPGPNPIYIPPNMGCDGIDGLAEGTTVSLIMIGRGDDQTCRQALGMLEQVPTGVNLIDPGKPEGDQGTFLTGSALATINGCSGRYTIEFFRVRGAPDPFAVPELGKTPSAVMLRRFSLDATAVAGCKSCVEYFVVQLQRPL